MRLVQNTTLVLLMSVAALSSQCASAAPKPDGVVRLALARCLVTTARLLAPGLAKTSELHSLSVSTSDELLYQAFLVARATQSTAVLKLEIIQNLTKVLGCTEAELLSPAVALEGLNYFAARLGSKKIEALQSQALVASTHDLHAMKIWGRQSIAPANSLIDVSLRESIAQAAAADLSDMNRTWGIKLLPDSDEAFRNPTYLKNLMLSSRTAGHGLKFEDPARSAILFTNEWARSAPQNTHVVQFYLTGSDANNSLTPIANAFAQVAYRNLEIDNAAVVPLAGSWVAGRGMAKKDNFVHRALVGDFDRPIISAPYINEFGKKFEGAELARQLALEAKSLDDVKKLHASGSLKLGAILLEPVLGPAGVKFFRPEYLMKLRALCDELGIAIVADEVLTGGGRTGRFFAYQHYQGFEPDFITFGKGLIVSGIAAVDRKHPNYPTHFTLKNEVTLEHFAEPLLKSAAIMKRIREGRLAQNAAEVGAYFLKQIQAYQSTLVGGSSYEHARGLGLLIYFDRADAIAEHSAFGRLMPYLTLTKSDVDDIIYSLRHGSRSQPKPLN